MKTITLSLLFLTFSVITVAQQTYGDSLSLQVEAQIVSNQIQVNWPVDLQAETILVYRKTQNANVWGSPIASLVGSATTYIDNSAAINTVYNYYVEMNSSSQSKRTGYVTSAVQLKANGNRGIALVVIENTYILNPNYQAAIDQYILDLECDGWFPKPLYVNKADDVALVKSGIVSLYNQNPTATSMLVLLGNVPVPYSGEINPDGHTDHLGAWPCDGFYADMNGSWTDITVNNATASNPLNHNIPGDGKFDQDYFASTLELSVGRIDFSNLPTSGVEEDLMLTYLNKLHNYKNRNWFVTERALIDDEFTGYPEGFSQNGYRNFAPLVGRSNIQIGDYITNLSIPSNSNTGYLWAYGCGGGWFSGAGGIGSSGNFASDSLSAVFTMLFGSYFGDWNYQDGFLKTSLANGNALTTVWAGRPNWHFYDMGIGEPIANCAKLTQNNTNTYTTNTTYTFFGKMVSLNLLGDPALRQLYADGISNVQAQAIQDKIQLTWNNTSGVDGYNVYRRFSDSSYFEKLNDALLTSNSFIDSTLVSAGEVNYYVKAVELTTNSSGNYEKESIGERVQAYSVVGLNESTVLPFEVFPNPTNGLFQVISPEKLSYKLMELNGVIVQEGVFEAGVNVVSISQLADGIYLLSVVGNTSKSMRPTRIVLKN